MNSYLCYQNVSYPEFRIPVESLAKLEDIPFSLDLSNFSPQYPFVPISLSCHKDASRLIKRSILTKDIMHLWGEASTREELVQIINNIPIEYYESLNQTLINNQNKDSTLNLKDFHFSFRFNVMGFNKKIQECEKIEIIEMFRFLPLSGEINLKNPDVIFCIWEAYEPHQKTPFKVYFGVYIGSGDQESTLKFDLRKREYLGTTTMDPQLSLIMSNMALVRDDSFIYDPFCGTGSFLLTSSHYGAFSFGSDIDGRQIKGKSSQNKRIVMNDVNDENKNECEKDSMKTLVQKFKKFPISSKRSEFKRDVMKLLLNDEKSIQSNIEQYNLESKILGTVICDIAHHPWRACEWYDAIICDPPYGIRAGAKKIGLSNSDQNNIVKNIDSVHSYIKKNGEPKYPTTVEYQIDELLVDLFDFASIYLVTGGRLVFWLPTTEEFTKHDIPYHPRFKLLYNSEIKYTKWARRLITMEKIQCEIHSSFKPSEEIHIQPAHSTFRKKYFEKKV